MPKYYDGTKLLSMKDLDGNTPEIFMVTSNRTAGKTTYFNRLVFLVFCKFCCFLHSKTEVSIKYYISPFSMP